MIYRDLAYKNIAVHCARIMYIYKAIIWLSLLAIIGEGVVFSGFNFIPNKDARGEVLGERTDKVLDDLVFTRFPASYYAEAVQSVSPELADQILPNTEEQNNATSVADEQSSSSNNSRDALVQILNTPSQYEISFPRERAREPLSDDTSVDAIIKKNERLYREQIIKELNTIKDQYKDIAAGS